MPTFNQWLANQVHWDRPTGDLARDAEGDLESGELHGADTKRTWRRYLAIEDADDATVEALDEAWKECGKHELGSVDQASALLPSHTHTVAFVTRLLMHRTIHGLSKPPASPPWKP